MPKKSTTLYVTNISSGVRAKDLAREFERYGRLVRCDIPAGRAYAFIEYEDERDADDAQYEMDNKKFEGRRLIVEVCVL